MKLPRGVSGGRVAGALERLGYVEIRRKGSHVRLRHDGPPTHHVTVPMHSAVTIGTLHEILTEVARMRSIRIESIIQIL